MSAPEAPHRGPSRSRRGPSRSRCRCGSSPRGRRGPLCGYRLRARSSVGCECSSSECRRRFWRWSRWISVGYGHYAQVSRRIQQTFDGLKQRAIALQDSAPQMVNQTRDAVEAPKNEVIATVQDMGDVSTPPLAVLNHLSWAAVLVFFANVSATISGYVLNPFIGTFVGGFGASIAALVALPYYAKYSIDQDVAASVSESSIRFKLLGLALGEGALVGYVLSNSYLSASPLAALFPLITAVAYPFAAEKFGGKRQMLVGGTVGVALGANLALGLLTGNLTATYFLASALYAGATFVTLQYIFKNVTSAEAPAFQYQFGLLVAFVGINLLTHFLFGMNPEAYAQYVNRPVSA